MFSTPVNPYFRDGHSGPLMSSRAFRIGQGCVLVAFKGGYGGGLSNVPVCMTTARGHGCPLRYRAIPAPGGSHVCRSYVVALRLPDQT